MCGAEVMPGAISCVWSGGAWGLFYVMTYDLVRVETNFVSSISRRGDHQKPDSLLFLD